MNEFLVDFAWNYSIIISAKSDFRTFVKTASVNNVNFKNELFVIFVPSLCELNLPIKK